MALYSKIEDDRDAFCAYCGLRQPVEGRGNLLSDHNREKPKVSYPHA